MMIGIMGNFLAAAKFFRDSESVLVFLIVVPCMLALVLLPVVGVLQAIFPDKFVIGFNYYRHAKERNSKGYTAEQLGEIMLKYAGISDVRVVKSEDEWGHSFEPDVNAVVLSKPFYGKSDMRSICAAVHECGHAMQHHGIQSSSGSPGEKIVKVSKVISWVMTLVLLALMFIVKARVGLSPELLIVFMLAIVLCSVLPRILISNPYERDANNRATALLEEHDIIDSEEITVIRKMLKKQYHDHDPNASTTGLD